MVPRGGSLLTVEPLTSPQMAPLVLHLWLLVKCLDYYQNEYLAFDGVVCYCHTVLLWLGRFLSE